MQLSVESRADRGQPASGRWRPSIDAGASSGDAGSFAVLDRFIRDPEIMSEAERLLSGRTRDIRLKGRLAEAYRQRSWRPTAKVIRAWMIWVMLVDVLMLTLNMFMLPREMAVAMLAPGAVIVLASLLVAFVWRTPHPQGVLGTALITGITVILLSICVMGLASGGMLLDRYLHIMLFVAITAVVIFSIPFGQTLTIAVTGMGLYLAFQLGASDASIWTSLSGFFFFAAGMGATVMARRTMNILAHKSFLLELRDRQHLAELAQTNLRLERLSRIDGLTGAANRHFMRERIDELWRRKGDVALLMCDIDDFKALNDHLGHLEGDRCLVEVARIIMSCTRSEADCVARYGGEEFLVLLADADEAEALSVAERIRREVAAAALANPGSRVKPTVTLSIGVAAGQTQTAALSSETMQKRADTALYFAKRTGRNQVRLWSRAMNDFDTIGSVA
jgi:diguanylate cyclase (GGDEF)-like protein